MVESPLIKVCLNNYKKCTQTRYLRSINRSNRIFLNIPYSPSYSIYEKIIIKVCRNAGLKPIIAKQEKKSEIMLCKICRLIQSCSLGIVDISYNRPNIFYEYGFMQAIGLKCAILRKKGTRKIPSDILGKEYLSYSNEITLQKELTSWIFDNYPPLMKATLELTHSIESISAFIKKGNKNLAMLSLTDMLDLFDDKILKSKLRDITQIINTLLNDKNKEIRADTTLIVLQSRTKVLSNLRNDLITNILTHGDELIRVRFCDFLKDVKVPPSKNRLNNIVGILSRDPSSAVKSNLVGVLGNYYEKLNKSNQQHIIGYSTDEDIDVRKATLDTVWENFMKLQPNVRYVIIENFSKDEEPKIRRSLVNIIEEYTDDLPKEYRENILLQLAKDSRKTVRKRVAYCLSHYLDVLDRDKSLEILEVLSRDSYKDIANRARAGIKRLKKF